jgi:hypothetical protein
MTQPEESKAKTSSTDDILPRTPNEGVREPEEAIRPPEEELPEEERRHSKPQHKLTG